MMLIGTAAPALELTAIDGRVIGANPIWRKVIHSDPPPVDSRASRASSSPRTDARWIGIASGLWAGADELIAYRDQQHIVMPPTLVESGALFRAFGATEVPALLLVDASPPARIS